MNIFPAPIHRDTSPVKMASNDVDEASLFADKGRVKCVQTHTYTQTLTQTMIQTNQARPSISSTVQVCRCIGDSAYIYISCIMYIAVYECVCVHIDALQQRGVLARYQTVVFYKTCTRNISLFFFPFVGSSNDAITYVNTVHCTVYTVDTQRQKQITFRAL